MANKNFQINLAFTADTSKAKQQLMDLQSSLQKIINEPVNPRAVEGMRNSLVAAGNAAATLQAHLQAATNVKTGTLDFTKLNKSLSQSKINLVDYAKKLQGIGEEGQKAFLQLAEVISTAEVPLRRSSQLLNKFWENLKKTAGWQISSNIIHGLEGAITSAYGYAQDLNESLNNIRIVTGQNVDQMAKFAAQANKAAKALSTTTTNYTNASLIYYQQGLSDQEVLERTDITIKMANVARTSAEDVSDQMTAVWNNFYDGSKSLEYYADVMTALGAATASSTEEISAGLNKFAAVAETVGLSYEYAASALATVTSTTRQSADVVGTAFKTLFARIQDLKLGETLDDGTTLGTYSESLAKVGIDIKGVNDEVKDMDTILEEMAGKWKTLDKDAQIALAQNVAGVRQYTQLIALMDNWDFFQENLQTSLNSSGALNEQAEIYAEGWEAAQDRVTASLEAIYSKLIDDEAFIDILNIFSEILEYVDTLITSFGGLGGVITSLGAILTKVFSTQISQSMQTFAYNLQMLTPKGQKAVEDARQSQLNDLISSMVTIDFDDPESKKRQEIFSEQLKYQVQFSDKAKEMSETERLINQILLDRLKIQGEALVNQERQKAEANSLKEDYLVAGRTLVERKGKAEGLTNKQISDSQGDYSNSFKELETIVKLRLDTSIFERDKKIALEKIKIVQNALSKFDKGHQGKGKEESKELRTLLSNLKEADFEGENLKETLKKLRAELDKAQTNTQKKIIELSGEDIENIEAATQAIIDYARACQEAENGTEDFSKIAEKFGDNLDNIQGKQKEWSDNLVASADVILTTVSVLQSLKGIIDTLNDPDISGWDKFLAVLSTVGTMVPMVMSSINSLTTIYKASTAAASGAAGANAAAGVGMGAAGASAAGATPAVTGLATAFNALIWPITLVALAIVGVVAAISAFATIWDETHINEQENLQHTSELLDKVSNQYDELITKAENFKDAINSYDSAIETLDSLEKGTKEYAKALENANQKALALIKTYELYGKFSYNEEGLIVIDPQAIDDYEENLLVNTAQTYSAQQYGEIINDQAKFDLKIEQIPEKIGEDFFKARATSAGYQKESVKLKDKQVEQILNFFRNIDFTDLNDTALKSQLENLQSSQKIFTSYTNENLDALVRNREVFQDLVEEERKLGELTKDRLQKIITNEIQTKYNEKIIEAATKNGITDAGAQTLIGQAVGKIVGDKVEKLTLTENQTKTKNNIASNNSLEDALQSISGYTGDTTDFNDEKTAREYARLVLGMSEEEINDLVFVDKNGKGSLTDLKGNTIVDIQSDTFARKKIYEAAVFQTNKEQYLKDKEQNTKNAIEAFDTLYKNTSNLYGANFANSIMAEIASGNFSSLDLSATFRELSQSEYDELIQKARSKNNEDLLNSLGLTKEQIGNLGYQSVDAFKEAFTIGLEKWTIEDYISGRNAAGENMAKNYDLDLETFKTYRDLLFEQNELFKDNAEGANLLAIAQMRLDRGAQLITDDWEDLNSIMTSTETNSTTLAEALAQVAPALQDILNISAENYEFLPETFAKDNWNLIIKAISGETGALEDLRAAASQAILTSITSNENFTNENIAEIDNWLADQGKNLEIGVEINDEEFKTSCKDLIKEAEMTADEAEAYFASKGLEVQLVANTKNGQTTYTIESIVATGSANGVAGAINTINNLTNNKKNFELLDHNKEIENLKHTKDILAELENEYAKLNKEADKFYGTQKIKILQQINNNLKEQEKILEQQKVDAWVDYQDGLNELDSARRAIKDFNIAGWDLTLNEDLTRITNYESAMKGIIDEINRRKELYGNNEILYARKVQPLLKAYEDLKNAISLFDTGVADYRNAINAYQNNLDEQLAAKYKELTQKLEIQVEINDMELEEIDYYLNKISDDFKKMGEAAGLALDKFTHMEKSLKDQGDFYNDLTIAYNRGEISPADYVAGMKEARSAIYENLEAIQELSKEMQEYYGKTLDAFGEKIDENISRMESMTSVLDHYKNIMGILGKEQDYSRIGIILEGTAKTLKDQIEVVRAEYQFYVNEVNEKHALMEQAKAEGNQEVIDLYTKQWEQARDAMIETQDQMLSKTAEWAEAMKAITENKLSKFGEELEKALTGGASFEDMELSLKRTNSLQEEFLTTTNKIYETEKMMRTAQNAIDVSTNQVAKQKLQNFIQETKQLQNQGELSKYELEIQQAKYDLLVAEIALKDAQDAKTTVRLRRDAEGNVGYIYTADQQKVDNALQNFEDAQNALYNIGLEGANTYSEKYQQTLQEMHATLTEINTAWLNGEITSEEEYNRKMLEAKEYYYELLSDYSSLYQVALTTDSAVARDAWMDDHIDMINNTEEWQLAVDEYTMLSGEAMQEWQSVVNQVEKDTGLSYSKIQQSVKSVKDESNALRDAINGDNGLIKAMGEQINEVDKVVDKYVKEWMPKVIALTDQYEKLAKKIKEAISAESGASSLGGGTEVKEFDKTTDAYQAGYKAGYTLGYEQGYAGTGDKYQVSNHADYNYKKGYDHGYAKGWADGERQREADKKNGSELKYNVEKKNEGYKSAVALMGFDTGGYTGSWGPDGKLAVLHQKEIVLNAADTSNLLASVDLLHNILQVIDVQSMTRQLSGILSSPQFFNNNSQTLEQQVYIEAHFPDATDRNELEAAFNNIINQASQYANRK